MGTDDFAEAHRPTVPTERPTHHPSSTIHLAMRACNPRTNCWMRRHPPPATRPGRCFASPWSDPLKPAAEEARASTCTCQAATPSEPLCTLGDTPSPRPNMTRTRTRITRGLTHSRTQVAPRSYLHHWPLATGHWPPSWSSSCSLLQLCSPYCGAKGIRSIPLDARPSQARPKTCCMGPWPARAAWPSPFIGTALLGPPPHPHHRCVTRGGRGGQTRGWWHPCAKVQSAVARQIKMGRRIIDWHTSQRHSKLPQPGGCLLCPHPLSTSCPPGPRQWRLPSILTASFLLWSPWSTTPARPYPWPSRASRGHAVLTKMPACLHGIALAFARQKCPDAMIGPWPFFK